MHRIAAISIVALATAACVNASDRISDELVEAGLDAQRAQCVGDSLQRDLSINQLRQLANAARAYRTNDTTPGRLTASDLVRASAEVRDPAVTVAVAKAAGRCA